MIGGFGLTPMFRRTFENQLPLQRSQQMPDIIMYELWPDAYKARQEAWASGGDFGIEFYANELLGEVGETANILKKLHREYMGAPGSRATKEQLADEMADCLICLRNLALRLGQADRLSHPMAVTKKPKSLSGYGVLLGRFTGTAIDHACYVDQDPTSAGAAVNFLGLLQTALHQLAGYMNIDLNVAAINKWNATSVKNGFPHRLVLR